MKKSCRRLLNWLNSKATAPTTVQLAQTAGVNESTIFRHFGDKLGLATGLIVRYRKSLMDIIADFKPVWDLETDLIDFSRCFRKQWPKQHVMVMLMSTVKDPAQKQKLLRRLIRLKMAFKNRSRNI